MYFDTVHLPALLLSLFHFYLACCQIVQQTNITRTRVWANSRKGPSFYFSRESVKFTFEVIKRRHS